MSTAQVRRLYHHKQHGGNLSLRDIGYCVEVCEGLDLEIQQLQQKNQEMLKLIKECVDDLKCERQWNVRARALITKIEHDSEQEEE